MGHAGFPPLTLEFAVLTEDGAAYRPSRIGAIACPFCGHRGAAGVVVHRDATGEWAARCVCGQVFYRWRGDTTALRPTTLAYIDRRFLDLPHTLTAEEATATAHEGTIIYRGFAYRHSLNMEPAWAFPAPEGWTHAPGWDDGNFRAVWFSAAERGILTYAEGDIDLRLYRDAAAFSAAMTGAREFYGNFPLRK